MRGEGETGLFFFTERPRTEVARGGAPSLGGPGAELKLMDKRRQARNFHRINHRAEPYYLATSPAASVHAHPDPSFIEIAGPLFFS